MAQVKENNNQVRGGHACLTASGLKSSVGTGRQRLIMGDLSTSISQEKHITEGL